MTMPPKMVIITTAILPLLLFINTKQTSAQAPASTNGRSYGLGRYTMDGQDQQVTVTDARLLTAKDDVKSYKMNEHADMQSKPCRVKYEKRSASFQVFYDEDTAIGGCTVDFVFDKIDEIKARIVVADAGLSCLENCGDGRDEWTASNANLFPFTYSRSNEEIKKLHSGPPYNEEDQTSCKSECKDNGGKCMASPTSLQFAMNKCKSQVRAWIHLVGEPLSSWSIGQKEIDTPEFDLTIATGDNPTITIESLADDGTSIDKPHGTDEKPVATLNCFTNKLPVPIPVPQFWKIKSGNEQINGKHLLVFHLLPQAATRIFNGQGQLQKDQPPAPGMPNCKGKLSIGILNAVGILQNVPKTTTTQTTEMTTSIGTTSTASGGTAATASGGATNSHTTTGTKSETTDASINVWMIVAVVGWTMLLLGIVANVVWCLCCRNKKQKDAEMGKAPVKKAKQKADDDDSDEDAHDYEHEGVSVPESVYCKGVSVPDTVQTDYVE